MSDTEEVLQLTADDVRHLLSLIDSLPAETLESGTPAWETLAVAEQLRELRLDVGELAWEVALTVRDLDLEALSSSLLGITDPIGQIKSWLVDQLKGLASWFASIVDGIVRNLWSTFIKPALDAISYVVSGIRDRIASIGDTIASLAGQISSVLSKVGEVASAVGGIVNSIISSVSSIISGLKDFISSSLAGVISSINQAIGSIASGLKVAVDALARLPDTIKSIVSGIADTIIRSVSSAIAGIGDTVKGILSGFVSTISDLFGKLGSAVSGLADQLVRGFGTLGTMLSGVLDTLKSLWAAMESALKSAAEGIGKAVASLGEQVVGALKGLASTVSDFFGKIASTLASVADYVSKGFAGLLDALRSGLGDLWSKVQGAIAAVSEAVSKALAPVVDTVTRGFAELGKWMVEAGRALQQVGVVIQGFVNAVLQLPERLSGLFKWIADAVEAVKNALLSFFKDPIGVLKKALEDIGKWIWNALPDWLKNAITAIQDFFAGLAQGLQDFIKNPLGFIQRGFSWLAEQIWKLLPDWLKGAIESIKGFFAWLWDELQKFAKDPLGYVYNMFKWIGEEIWKHLPEPLKWIIENVQKALATAWDVIVKFFTKDLPGFFAWLWEGVQAFLKNPLGWLQKNVGEPLWNLAKWLWDRIVEGVSWLWEQLQKLGGAIWKALTDVATAVWDAVSGTLQALALAAKGVAEAVVKAVFDLIAKAVVAAANLVEKALTQIIKEYARHIEALEEGGGKGEVTFMLSFPAAVIPAMATVYALPSAVSSMSYTVEGFELHGEGSGKPLGIGVAIAMRLRTAVLKALKEFGDMAKEALSDLMTGFWMGFFVAMWDTVKYLSRASWKKTFREVGLGDLPIEMPSERELVEFTRRVGIEEHAKKLKKLLDFYGYPDWYIEHLTKLEKELYIEVTDRFGTKRRIPLSPLYDWPSISEVAVWAIHDVFGAGRAGFEEYFKWAERMGVPRDIAILQYISRFKYPPPGTVWTFAARALAGLAWYTPSADDMAVSKAEAEFIGARAPLPPTALNFQAKKLFDALSVYMTWHDLANYAWLPDWTSDNWLVIDTLADIPGKIDVRWMCVPPDTLILGDNKPISEYRVGDETLYGGRVLEVFRRPYRGELVVIKGLGLLPIKVTPEHPILVVEGEIRWKYYRKNGRTMATTCKVFSKPYFIEAEKVCLAPARRTKGGYRFRRRGHYLVVPRLKGVYDVKEIDLSEYYRNYDLVPASIREKLGAKKPVLKLDEDLAWLFGFYVGDGSAWISSSVGQVRFYPSSEEHVKRIADIIERYGFKATVLRHGRCYEVIWSCRALARFFRENFGADAREKRIPYFILLHKDERILRAFLQGYLDADGNKAWRRDGVYEALTVSKSLALQIQLLCFRLGISCGITLKKEKQAGYRGDAYRLTILFKRDENHARIKFTDEFVLVPVVSVTREPYDGEVCNLETERNVYLVSNAIVHNCRYGLTDFMAAKGIGLKTPASQFTAVVEGAAKNPQLLMDLTLMSRLIQATGLHPYYVPIVVVAEAMQAFTDERTLLRTGIVDLYERGLADLQALDDLMSNLSVLSFKVAYFDMQAMEWREGFVNVPLSFLPGERKLIEMRAVIDRYMSIYGKALTEIVGGVRSLVLKPDEAKERLSKFADGVAKALSAAMKTVIGRDVQFKVDANYLNAWLAYAQLLVDVEQAERLRTFVSRVGGWLLYRVASGHVSDEELARVVEVLRKHFYMTETEVEAIFALAAAMRDIAKREPTPGETLPSLSTLATMAEYIEVPMDYIQRILAERRVEKTYAELWLRYIAARTISTEVNTLAGTYRRIVEYFGLPETLEKQVKELMRAGGWTERELQIFDLDLGLRRAYRILSTFIPTLRQFVGDAMYLGEWEKLFDDLLRARGLDAERYKAQVEYYRKLIKSRKLWRRVSMYITELVNCYAYDIVDEQTLRKELEPLKTYGLDDLEIELVVKTAKYRAARIAATRRY